MQIKLLKLKIIIVAQIGVAPAVNPCLTQLISVTLWSSVMGIIIYAAESRAVTRKFCTGSIRAGRLGHYRVAQRVCVDCLAQATQQNVRVKWRGERE